MAIAGLVRIVARRSLLVLFALGPLAVALDRLGAAGDLTIFLLAAAALTPLAWLIGEATDNAAYYTGAGIGGFLNATFANAPELIIALVAVSDGLTRSSAAGRCSAAIRAYRRQPVRPPSAACVVRGS